MTTTIPMTGNATVDGDIDIDSDVVRTCARMAQRAYAGPNTPVRGALPGDRFYAHSATDTQAYAVKREDGTLFIAFRGTEGRRDWRTNLRSWMTRAPGGLGWVHSGFLAAWRGIRDVMYPEIVSGVGPSAIGKISNVVVCGHSLGGALATLAALDLSRTCGADRVTCVTFGSPRVGGRSFCKAFAQAVRDGKILSARYAIHADPVPRVPSVVMAYRHVAGGVTLDRNPTCLSWLQDVTCSPIDDHDMARYIELVSGR